MSIGAPQAVRGGQIGSELRRQGVGDDVGPGCEALPDRGIFGPHLAAGPWTLKVPTLPMSKGPCLNPGNPRNV